MAGEAVARWVWVEPDDGTWAVEPLWVERTGSKRRRRLDSPPANPAQYTSYGLAADGLVVVARSSAPPDPLASERFLLRDASGAPRLHLEFRITPKPILSWARWYETHNGRVDRSVLVTLTPVLGIHPLTVRTTFEHVPDGTVATIDEERIEELTQRDLVVGPRDQRGERQRVLVRLAVRYQRGRPTLTETDRTTSVVRRGG